ncbi:hypothetical protein IGI04_025763 [Brassica rapa subsp. trilocularis]|uniref:Uncharacterized protein n=1 Tax=Brassica rapa subsp. trilocularis TaxID=1813537 RepID=A0ABQ7KWM2_BRACM|nr:hypothetical protein IGI04_025763 [Brassica rapa subsp. trilocularis]
MKSESDFGRLLRRLLEDSRKTFERLLGSLLIPGPVLKTLLLMYFMLEDFPRSLWEVFCPKCYKEMMSSGIQAYLC